MPYRPIVVFGLLAIGFIIAPSLPSIHVEWSLGVAFILCTSWLICRRILSVGWTTVAGRFIVCIAFVLLAASWWTVRYERFSQSELTPLLSASPTLWRVEGRVRTLPTVKSVSGGSLSQFAYQGPLTFFQFDIDRVIANDGQMEPLHGRVLIRIESPVRRYRVGDRLQIYGLLRSFPPAQNPGEFDRAQLAREQGLAGVLTTTSASNIQPIEIDTIGLLHRWVWDVRMFRSAVQVRVAGWLLRDLPTDDSTARESLLVALLLGHRGVELDELQDSFRNIGLSHLLSISGLHLAILVFTALFFVRLVNPPSGIERWLLILTIAIFLFVVPARIPVWRGGIMIIAFSAAGFSGRKFHSLCILAWTATLLLIVIPNQLFDAGFQLSFGIVAALIALSQPMRHRMFGEAQDIELMSTPEKGVEYGKSFLAATMVAWICSLPLVAFHFGMVNFIAPVATILATPFVLVILVAGYIKMIFGFFFPSVGVLLGPILLIATDALIGLITRLESVPIANMVVAKPGIVWTVLCLGWIIFVLQRKSEIRDSSSFGKRRYITICISLLFVFTLWKPGFLRIDRWFSSEVARVTMLSVGNGSCYIIESDGEVALFDAGSGSFLGVGDSIIVPALREMGILQVRTIIVSHGDVDHFSATIELMDEMRVEQILVPPHFMKSAMDDPLGPEAFLLFRAGELQVPVHKVARGESQRVGNVEMEWLNPIPDFEYAKTNDSSCVVRLQMGSLGMLLTGDIQKMAMQQLTEAFPLEQLQCDVMELPHHGAWSKEAVAFVQRLATPVILQSTGPARMFNDRWTDALLPTQERFISTEHGATTCVFFLDGSIEIETFLETAK